MTRNMYDGTNSLAAGIARAFPHAEMVAGYLNGFYAWRQAEWNLFPHAEHVTISVTASADAGDVLDVEGGDASPDECEAWIRMRKASGYYRPTIYCNLSTVPAVRQGTGAYILGRDYDLWVADYDGSTSSAYPGSVAKQYENTADYDISVVYDGGWPHRTAPAPAPSPTTVEVNVQLAALRQGGTGQAVRNWQGLLVAHGYGYLIAPLAGNVEEYAGVDGNFGANTAKATRKFQADRHLPVTGVVDAATWAAALG